MVAIPEARAAFVKMMKEENYVRPEYSRYSLRAHWSGASAGFADESVQRRFADFHAGWKAKP
jgi:hypothetical protein